MSEGPKTPTIGAWAFLGGAIGFVVGFYYLLMISGWVLPMNGRLAWLANRLQKTFSIRLTHRRIFQDSLKVTYLGRIDRVVPQQVDLFVDLIDCRIDGQFSNFVKL